MKFVLSLKTSINESQPLIFSFMYILILITGIGWSKLNQNEREFKEKSFLLSFLHFVHNFFFIRLGSLLNQNERGIKEKSLYGILSLSLME